VLSRVKRYTAIEPDELYRRIATGERMFVLDVRTEAEFDRRRIPGSVLVPLQEMEERLGELPNGGTPITVVDEHGQRCRSALERLAEHGFGPLYGLAGGLDRWPGPMISGTDGNNRHRLRISPSIFLIENFDRLPNGVALDVAMGEGRNAIYLATRGFDVDGVDSDPERVARARAAARKLGAPIRAVVGSFEDGTYIVPLEAYDVIVVFNYLHRPLFQDIRDGVRPGGVVVYQTYTAEHARFGKPQNPDFLLRPGELQQVFSDWGILATREEIGPSRHDGRMRAISGIVARKPS
jgi:rhodanese-related sulfurtransferase